MSVPIKIYCIDPTPRHDYIFTLFFEQLLGTTYVYVEFLVGSHLNYSNESSTTLSCIPQGILSESNLRERIKEQIEFKPWGDSHSFFHTGDGALPFDIFSAAFYLVSRYEEWLPYEADAHNRFPAEASVLTQNNLLDEPMVNQWAILLKEFLLKQDADLLFHESTFSYVSTIDVDMAWKYQHKGIVRNTLGACKDLLTGKWTDVKERLQVLLGSTPDPFETFGWQHALHKKYDVDCHYFVLLGDHGKYDKNTSHTNKAFRKRITELNTILQSNVGIHPSYASNDSPEKVAIEIARLADIVGDSPTTSRQHFLMHQMPNTYDTLVANGIQVDHTMGYSTHLGFRAGIASPFFWFDFRNNKASNICLVPFCAMDITPMHYMGQNEKEAITTLCMLVDKVKAVNGKYVSLWHNDSLSKDGRWRGWRTVYEEVIKYIKT
ncbi:MAG: polysaccharide deacetylase family protein [Bacteroidia bacterium]